MTYLKYILGVVVLGGILWAGINYPQVSQGFGSPVNTTFNTAKLAAINMVPVSITATTTAILNSDASDRIVLDAFVSCQNAGVAVYGMTATGPATWTWQAATSSTANTAGVTLTPTLGALNVTVATSSGDAYTATSTYTNVFARRWNAGTYMVFQTNATSSTASCNVGVHYLGT